MEDSDMSTLVVIISGSLRNEHGVPASVRLETATNITQRMEGFNSAWRGQGLQQRMEGSGLTL